MKGTIVIGAGQAACETIFTLRAQGYNKPITLIGKERYLPYQRPPLSKAYLLGDYDQQRLFFKAETLYEDKRIDVLLDTEVINIDRAANQIQLGDGTYMAYENLVIATGSRPRPLPMENGDKSNLFTIRSLDDIAHIKPYMQADKKVVIVGGGYIGLEFASVARKFGLKVTLIERMPRILARVARPETAKTLHDTHLSHGVDILTDVGISNLNAVDDKITSVTLTNNQEYECDFVVAGIGALANDELAKEAGLEVNNGIIVNEQCQTSDPSIYAAGDVTHFAHNRYGSIRLESVGNAIAQGQIAAKAILGDEKACYNAMPWFWSDQYDVKMQSVGLVMHDDVEVITRIGERKNSFSYWVYDKNGLLSVEAINDAKAYLMAKRWLEAGLSPNKSEIADTQSNLKNITTSPIML